MEDRSNYESLADEIRQAATQDKVPHSGSEHLPEDMRERPVVEFDNTSLEEAVRTHIDPENPPHDASSLTETPAPAAAPARQETSNNRRRNAVIGGVAALSLIAVGVLGIANRGGGDAKHEGNSEPTAGASQVPGQKGTEKGGSAEAPASITLDPRVSSDIQPFSDNQVDQIQNNQTWPNDIDKLISASINPADMNQFVDAGGFDSLLNQHPNWDELYSFYDKYMKSGGWGELMANNSVMAGIYNNSYAGGSQFYSQPHKFYSPDTADLIGKAPYVTMSEIHQAAQNADFVSLYNKMNPVERGSNVLKAFMGEVKAGNNDPELVDTMTTAAFLQNPVSGDVDFFKTALAKYQTDYQTDPKSAEGDLVPRPVTREDVRVLGIQRFATGQKNTLTDYSYSPDNTAITSALVYEKDTVTDQDGQKSSVITVSVVAFPIAPATNGQEKAVQMVTLDSIQMAE